MGAGRYFVGDICEVIVLDHLATAEERNAITAALLRKWGIAPEEEQEFPDVLSLKSLSIDAQGGATAPFLGLLGDVSVSGLDLTLLNMDDVVRRCTLVKSSGEVSGPFRSVTGCDFGTVEFVDGAAAFRPNRGVLLILR